MKRTILLLLICMTLLVMSACGEKTENNNAGTPDQAASSDSAAVSETVAETVAETPVYIIKAGSFELKYPERWKDKVQATASDSGASFACGEVKLFDILFNSNEGHVLGVIKGEKENTLVSVVEYPLEKETEELIEMQQDLNVILRHMSEDYDFSMNGEVENEDDSTFDIETSVVTLKYPAKWKDKVNTEVTDKGVSFSNGDTKLFDLVFEKCDGYLLGTYKEIPIYVIDDYPVKGDEQTAMQADVNVIFKNLQAEKDFVINN